MATALVLMISFHENSLRNLATTNPFFLSKWCVECQLCIILPTSEHTSFYSQTEEGASAGPTTVDTVAEAIDVTVCSPASFILFADKKKTEVC